MLRHTDILTDAAHISRRCRRINIYRHRLSVNASNFPHLLGGDNIHHILHIQISSYIKDLYCVQHLVENTFLYLKLWRGIAPKYTKILTSFEAAVQIRCIPASSHRHSQCRASPAIGSYRTCRSGRTRYPGRPRRLSLLPKSNRAYS